MPKHLALVSVVVRDYDEAITFYRDTLGFVLAEDTRLDAEKRWVVVKPTTESQAGLLLAKASGPEQDAIVGGQTAGRVFLFLNTDDIDRDYATYTARGVEFTRKPTSMPYGRVAVFRDLYGNLWDLIEPSNTAAASAA